MELRGPIYLDSTLKNQKENSLEILNKCLEEIRNTTVEEYENIKKEKKLNFEELYVAKPHVFISNNHPLADKDEITIQDLMPYPYLVFEQGKHNSFYFSEEFLSSLEFPKNIMVRDRATLFNLLIGLNGFTVCSGIIDTELNGENIISKPLDSDCSMRIGILTRKNSVLSRYGVSYLNVLKNHLLIHFELHLGLINFEQNLLYLYYYQKYNKHSYLLLLLFLFIDNSFAILYLALFFYSLNK